METTNTKMVKIANIKVCKRKRQVDLEKLKPLKNSIQISGLMQPIILSSNLKLIAGNHRLEAFKALGKTEIPAIVVDVDEIQAELMEIDENLIRKSLTKLERDEQILRRKNLYEKLHPEATKEAIVKKNLPKRKDSILEYEDSEPVESFVENTSQQTGMSKRSIQQSIKNAKSITPEVREKIKGTPIEDKTTSLAKLAQTSPEKQLEVVEEELKNLDKPKRTKAKKETEDISVQAEPVFVSDSLESENKAKDALEKELDIAYKVDFVRKKVVVDGKWFELPSKYNMDNNSYNNMVAVAKNYISTKGNMDEYKPVV